MVVDGDLSHYPPEHDVDVPAPPGARVVTAEGFSQDQMQLLLLRAKVGGEVAVSGDGEVGRWGEREVGRWGGGEVGRKGEREKGRVGSLPAGVNLIEAQGAGDAAGVAVSLNQAHEDDLERARGGEGGGGVRNNPIAKLDLIDLIAQGHPSPDCPLTCTCAIAPMLWAWIRAGLPR